MAASPQPGQHVALLRGINVGRAKRIAMADLRALFAALGFSDPRTLLNSGNVVFGASAPAAGDPSLAARIEAALVEQIGVASRVTVLDAARLAAIVAANPLAASTADHSRLLAFTLPGSREQALLAPLAQQQWGGDRLHVGEWAAYVACPGGVLDSKLAMAVTKALGEVTTARNWNTVLKLHALCDSAMA
jgi:uncharacterized protein (DUF1697 family)